MSSEPASTGRNWGVMDVVAALLGLSGVALAGVGGYLHLTIAARVAAGRCDACAPWHPLFVVAPLVVGVVLLFYPFDFSPVCTEEICTFRDSEWLTFTPDLDVFGLSTDSAFAHRAVIQEHDLPFPLLSDHDGSVSEAFGVLYDELEGHRRVSKRAVFVLDGDMTVQYAWVADEWLTDPDIWAVHGALEDAGLIT